MQRLDKGELQLRENTLPEACCLFSFFFHFVLSKACSPLFTQNTDEGKAQLLGVNTHMQYGVHIRSHARPQMYREQEIDERIQVGIETLISRHNVSRRVGLFGFIRSLLVKRVLIKRKLARA